MTFQQPALLLGLLAVVVLGGLYVLAQRRRRIYAMRFTNLELLRSVAGKGPGLRRHLPPALLLLGVTALVLGMAGPLLNLEVARTDASVMLVIDVSGSMAASDVQPSRIEAARSAASSLVSQLPSADRIGLISFNSYATLAAPLTDDKSAVQNALSNLQAGGGTAIGDALQLATQTLVASMPSATATKPVAMIVLLTDGVSNRGVDALAAAAQAKAAHIPVQTIGIGTRDASVTIQGRPVGGVDEQALGAIATATGGKYYFAEAAGQLSQIYASLGTEFGWRFLRLDITVPTLVLGTVVVLAAATASLLWFRVLP